MSPNEHTEYLRVKERKMYFWPKEIDFFTYWTPGEKSENALEQVFNI